LTADGSADGIQLIATRNIFGSDTLTAFAALFAGLKARDSSDEEYVFRSDHFVFDVLHGSHNLDKNREEPPCNLGLIGPLQ